jgi:hypothetical protein
MLNMTVLGNVSILAVFPTRQISFYTSRFCRNWSLNYSVLVFFSSTVKNGHAGTNLEVLTNDAERVIYLNYPLHLLRACRVIMMLSATKTKLCAVELNALHVGQQQQASIVRHKEE